MAAGNVAEHSASWPHCSCSATPQAHKDATRRTVANDCVLFMALMDMGAVQVSALGKDWEKALAPLTDGEKRWCRHLTQSHHRLTRQGAQA